LKARHSQPPPSVEESSVEAAPPLDAPAVEASSAPDTTPEEEGGSDETATISGFGGDGAALEVKEDDLVEGAEQLARFDHELSAEEGEEELASPAALLGISASASLGEAFDDREAPDRAGAEGYGAPRWAEPADEKEERLDDVQDGAASAADLVRGPQLQPREGEPGSDGDDEGPLAEGRFADAGNGDEDQESDQDQDQDESD